MSKKMAVLFFGFAFSYAAAGTGSTPYLCQKRCITAWMSCARSPAAEQCNEEYKACSSRCPPVVDGM